MSVMAWVARSITGPAGSSHISHIRWEQPSTFSLCPLHFSVTLSLALVMYSLHPEVYDLLWQEIVVNKTLKVCSVLFTSLYHLLLALKGRIGHTLPSPIQHSGDLWWLKVYIHIYICTWGLLFWSNGILIAPNLNFLLVSTPLCCLCWAHRRCRRLKASGAVLVLLPAQRVNGRPASVSAL